jgi:putative ABC transport system permease protein
MVTGRSRLRVSDLAREALAGILQRPGRSALTMAGTMLGIGAFVAILGLTTTAAAQISSQFSAFAATQVTVADAGDSGNQAVLDFPPDADARIDSLHGVVSAGVYWQVDTGQSQIGLTPQTGATTGVSLGVYAATPGLLPASAAILSAGVPLNSFYENQDQPVALLGTTAAAQLGITSLRNTPIVYIGDSAYTVIGLVSAAPRLPALALSVIIPASVALAQYGPPDPSSPAQMIIHTRLGAAQLIASQAPVALRPDNPRLLSATSAAGLAHLQQGVSFTVNSLFLLLAAVSVAVGMLGIANMTLVAVIERTPEIGLRRALGARPRHIASQILAESGTVGLIGALVGASLGILTVLAVALVRHWTAVLDPVTVFPAPGAGLVTGLLAGIYPALRAATIEPAAALRR